MNVSCRTRAVVALSAIAALSFVPSRAVAEPLSISDAIRMVCERNETILAAGEEVREKKAQREAAKALYWPKIDLGARATQLDDEIAIDLDPIRQVILGLHPNVPPKAIPPFVLGVQDEQFTRSHLAMSWPLYTGGKASAVNEAAAATVRESEQQRRVAQQLVTLELVRRYYGLRLALRVADVRRDVLSGLDQHVFQARRLEEEGFISRAERLSADVAKAEAERQLSGAEHDVALARTALEGILSSDGPVEPSSPLFVITRDLPLDEFRAKAIESSPALLRLAELRVAASAGVRAERGTLLPDVYAFVVYELEKDDLTILDPEWAVGVGASVTLFDRNARLHRIAAARSRETRIGLVSERARIDVGTLVERNYRETRRALELYRKLETTLELARENLRVRSRAFEEGMATSLEVVDARLSLSRVEIERLAAARDFDVALAELLASAGEIERFDEMRASADAEVN